MNFAVLASALGLRAVRRSQLGQSAQGTRLEVIDVNSAKAGKDSKVPQDVRGVGLKVWGVGFRV